MVAAGVAAMTALTEAAMLACHWRAQLPSSF